MSDIKTWKQKVNLYHLIQRHCDRPAYFWHNYKWSIPLIRGSSRPMSTEEALQAGFSFEIWEALATGFDLQKWCDTH